MMGVFQITVYGEAPQLFVGSEVGGAKIVSIKDVSPKLVSASELAQQYGISVDAVRDRWHSWKMPLRSRAGKFDFDCPACGKTRTQ